MSRKYLQELIKSLQEFYKCPSCETNYHLDDIKFLGQIELFCFVQLTCHGCSLPILATVSLSGSSSKTSSTSTKRKKTDLRQKEQVKFARKGVISAGEIADLHIQLSRMKGGFGKLVD